MRNRITESEEERMEMDTAIQVFANSPVMLALCLTAIGLIKIYTTLQRITTLLDNCLAFGVLAFLCSTMLAYLALRASTRKRRLKLGKIADLVFLAGLACAAAVAVIATFVLAG